MLRASNNIKIDTLFILKRCANKLFYALVAFPHMIFHPSADSISFLHFIDASRRCFREKEEEEKTSFFSALVQPHTNKNIIIRCFESCFRFTPWLHHTLTIRIMFRLVALALHIFFFMLCYHYYDCSYCCNHRHCSDAAVNCCCCSHTLLLFQIYRQNCSQILLYTFRSRVRCFFSHSVLRGKKRNVSANLDFHFSLKYLNFFHQTFFLLVLLHL